MEAEATSDELTRWINHVVKAMLHPSNRPMSRASLEQELRQRLDPRFDLKAVRGQRGRGRKPRRVTRRAILVLAEVCNVDPDEGLRLWDACIRQPNESFSTTPNSAAAIPAIRGRTTEIAAAMSLLRKATETAGGVTLAIVGEQGIGKTTVALAIAAAARRDGAVVIAVDSLAPGLMGLEAALGWQPVIGATSDVARDDARQLVSLFEHRLALIREQLGAAARRQRMLVLIEDIHRSDGSSLDAVRRLAQGSVPGPLLLLVTARLGMAVDRADVAGLVREADEQMVLGPLDNAALREVISDRCARLKGRVERDLATLVTERVRGHPGLAVSLLDRHLVDGDWKPGSDLQRLASDSREAAESHWRARICQLPSSTQEVLCLAAVVGTGFDVRMIRSLSGSSRRHRVGPDLDIAISARVIEVTTMATRFRFTHEWAQIAALSDSSDWVRAEIHRQVADLLCSTEGRILVPDDVERLVQAADHLELAQESYIDGPARFAEVSRDAAGFALERFEPDLARSLLDPALAVTRNQPSTCRPLRAQLLRMRAAIELSQGQRNGYMAEAIWVAADDRGVDVDMLVDWLSVYIVWSPVGRDNDEIARMRARIRELLGSDRHDLEAELLAGEALHILWGSHPTRFDHERIDDLLDNAESQIASDAGPRALHTTRMVRNVRALVAQQRPHAAEAMRRARQSSNLGLTLFGSFYRIDTVDHRIEFHAAVRLGERETADRIAREYREAVLQRSWLIDACFADMLDAVIAMLEARFVDAFNLLDAATQRLTVDDDNLALLFYTQRLWYLHETSRGEARVLANLAVEMAPQFPASRAVAAMLHAHHGGDAAISRRIVVELLGEGLGALPVDVTRSLYLPILAETLVLLDESRWAIELYDALDKYRGEILVGATPSHAHGAADRFCGMLAPLAGHTVAEACVHFERALAVEQQLRAPALAARTMFWYGRTLGRFASDPDETRVAADVLYDALDGVPAKMDDLKADTERELARLLRRSASRRQR